MFIYAFTAVKCEYVHVLMNTQYHTYNSLSDCVCACVRACVRACVCVWYYPLVGQNHHPLDYLDGQREHIYHTIAISSINTYPSVRATRILTTDVRCLVIWNITRASRVQNFNLQRYLCTIYMVKHLLFDVLRIGMYEVVNYTKR